MLFALLLLPACQILDLIQFYFHWQSSLLLLHHHLPFHAMMNRSLFSVNYYYWRTYQHNLSWKGKEIIVYIIYVIMIPPVVTREHGTNVQHMWLTVMGVHYFIMVVVISVVNFSRPRPSCEPLGGQTRLHLYRMYIRSYGSTLCNTVTSSAEAPLSTILSI